MKRLHLMIAITTLCTAQAVSQSVCFSTSFDSGIPATFSLWDVDGLEPSNSMAAAGFAVGVPWIPVTDDAGNGMACSTSWYKKAGTSNDWLVTPPFTVAGSDATLTWRGRAHDARHPDGYIVLVSATGPNPEDFDTATPLYTVAAENASWTAHEASLAQWQGQQVWVAVVNNSTNQSRLYIDDLHAASAAPLQVRGTTPQIVTTPEQAVVSGEVYATGSTAVEGFDITVEWEGGSCTQHFATTVQPGEMVPFALDQAVPVAANQTMPYRLSVTAQERTTWVDGQLSCYRQAIVVEEFSGTWCSWCPRGIVMMNRLAQEHPDEFIGIVVHNNDPMALDDYQAGIAGILNIPGYPYSVTMRDSETGCDPRDLEVVYGMYAGSLALEAGVALQAAYNAATGKVDATATVNFVNEHPEAAYRLAYVVTEDSVHVPDDGNYNQSNAYAGGESGAMGGFESLPNPVPASQMYYEAVARGFVGDDFNGIEGSLPASITARQDIEHSITFDLPATVLRPEMANVVAMVIGPDRRIVNAARVRLQVEDPALRGDVNGDGLVDASDVTTLVSMIVGTVPATAAADLNGDCNVDASDVTTLVGVIVGTAAAAPATL